MPFAKVDELPRFLQKRTSFGESNRTRNILTRFFRIVLVLVNLTGYSSENVLPRLVQKSPSFGNPIVVGSCLLRLEIKAFGLFF